MYFAGIPAVPVISSSEKLLYELIHCRVIERLLYRLCSRSWVHRQPVFHFQCFSAGCIHISVQSINSVASSFGSYMMLFDFETSGKSSPFYNS